jgi:hypothetical protein
MLLNESDVPHSDLTQLAQVGLYGGHILVFFHWANNRVYIQERFSNGTANWTSHQDDRVRSTLEQRGMLCNTVIKNAVIVDGQTGPRAAPDTFIDQNWSTFIARREVLSFDIELEHIEPEPVLEYIAATVLFGF